MSLLTRVGRSDARSCIIHITFPISFKLSLGIQPFANSIYNRIRYENTVLLKIGPVPKVLGELNNKVDKYFIVLLKREISSTKRRSECENYCSNRRTFF